MLLCTAVLERIVRGEVSLVFRRWRRPTVRSGGSLRTALGVLRILNVAPVAEADISEADAARAGFPSRAELLEGLGSREGQVYRIAVEYAGADPRVALRRQDDLSVVEVEQIIERLQRLDARSSRRSVDGARAGGRSRRSPASSAGRWQNGWIAPTDLVEAAGAGS